MMATNFDSPGTGSDGTSDGENVIRVGDVVVLQRLNFLRTYQVSTRRNDRDCSPSVQLGSDHIVDLTNALGHELGTTFKMIKKDGEKKGFALQKVDGNVTDFEDLYQNQQEGGLDNRDIVDVTTSQKLSQEDIESMKEEGKSGTEIVEKLVENSDTFQRKTKFSQTKFLRKKAGKYFEYVCIRRPTIRLLMQIHYRADPTKIMNLRIDSLAQMLNLANVQQGSRVIVYEANCQGLIVASVLERLGAANESRVFHVFPTGHPVTNCVNAMNFPNDIRRNLHTLNMHHLRTLEQGHDICQVHKKPGDKEESQSAVSPRQVLREQSLASFEALKMEGADAIIIASRQHPANILTSLLKYLKISRPFVVFSPYKEPLLETYMQVKKSGRAIMVTLSESFFRLHQVLPGRTHPEVNMSGGGGFVLSGTYVDNADEDGVVSQRENGQPPEKRGRQPSDQEGVE